MPSRKSDLTHTSGEPVSTVIEASDHDCMTAFVMIAAQGQKVAALCGQMEHTRVGGS
jgi:hypothetical protein